MKSFNKKKPLVQKFNLNDDDQKKAARTEVPGQLPALCAAINEGKNRRGAALPGRWGAAPLRVGPQQVGRPGLLRNRKSNQRSPGTDPFVYPSAPRERSKVTQPGRPSGSSSSQRDKQREGSSIPPDQRRDCRQGCSATNQVATKWRPEGHPGRFLLRRNPGGPQRHGSEVLQSIPSLVCCSSVAAIPPGGAWWAAEQPWKCSNPGPSSTRNESYFKFRARDCPAGAQLPSSLPFRTKCRKLEGQLIPFLF